MVLPMIMTQTMNLCTLPSMTHQYTVYQMVKMILMRTMTWSIRHHLKTKEHHHLYPQELKYANLNKTLYFVFTLSLFFRFKSKKRSKDRNVEKAVSQIVLSLMRNHTVSRLLALKDQLGVTIAKTFYGVSNVKDTNVKVSNNSINSKHTSNQMSN